MPLARKYRIVLTSSPWVSKDVNDLDRLGIRLTSMFATFK